MIPSWTAKNWYSTFFAYQNLCLRAAALNFTRKYFAVAATKFLSWSFVITFLNEDSTHVKIILDSKSF